MHVLHGGNLAFAIPSVCPLPCPSPTCELWEALKSSKEVTAKCLSVGSLSMSMITLRLHTFPDCVGSLLFIPTLHSLELFALFTV